MVKNLFKYFIKFKNNKQNYLPLMQRQRKLQNTFFVLINYYKKLLTYILYLSSSEFNNSLYSFNNVDAVSFIEQNKDNLETKIDFIYSNNYFTLYTDLSISPSQQTFFITNLKSFLLNTYEFINTMYEQLEQSKDNTFTTDFIDDIQQNLDQINESLSNLIDFNENTLQMKELYKTQKNLLISDSIINALYVNSADKDVIELLRFSSLSGLSINFYSNHDLYKIFVLMINDFLKFSYQTNNRLKTTLSKLLTEKIDDYNNTKEQIENGTFDQKTDNTNLDSSTTIDGLTISSDDTQNLINNLNKIKDKLNNLKCQ